VKTSNLLTDQILELELEMFLSVPTAGRANCQEDPDRFKLHRRAQFSAWSAATLQSYLIDLRRAKSVGRNLVTVKYARMDNLLPCENPSPLIDSIVELVMDGQRRVIADYPRLMSGGRPLSEEEAGSGLTSFATYLRCELETYSETTLKLLYRDVLALGQVGSSLSEATYRSLAGLLGFDSLEALEESLVGDHQL
jgi:hypothetical protein